MEPVAKKLQKAYVYEVELPYGLDLIYEGRPIIFEIPFQSDCKYQAGPGEQFDFTTFLDDFSNKTDHPLGVIKNGIIEIYESNAYKLMEIPFSYSFPLNILRQGDMLGTFGATDLLFRSDIKNQYGYSALCGNYCVYPFLPREFSGGQEKYTKRLNALAKDHKLSFGTEEQLFSFFPRLLKAFYKLSDKKVTLILIPDVWYGTCSPVNTHLRSLISKIAWLQSTESRLNDSRIVPIRKELGIKAANKSHLFSEMIVYLQGVLEGKRLILKPVDNESDLFDIYLRLKNEFEEIYDPVLFHFDFLRQNEWGIFPLFTFPTTNPIDPITNGRKFLKDFHDAVQGHFDKDIISLRMKCYFENSFAEEHFPKRNIYSKFLLISSVLKVS
jgi:hypothetical protein